VIRELHFFNEWIGKEDDSVDTYIQRTHPRNDYLAPIKYSSDISGGYEDARIYNYSKDGFGIEPRERTDPGRQIYILTSNYSPGTNGPEAFKRYLARIQWCRENEDQSDFPFRAGVQILSMSHDLIEGNDCPMKSNCDLCGRPTESGKIMHTKGSADLCPNCYDHFMKIPNGLLKRSIERFIIGNVI
jgi:hypothetical protein